MYRQTDDRKVWYEWIVEVFARDTSSPTAAVATSSGASTPSSLLTSSSLASTAGKGSEADKDKPTRVVKRVRVAMSELHSSIKDGCLM
ncbi:hypothetical protein AJ78_08599 [Emergomyces pasteurianus Ep9510]|uniref:Uncharacterized protein n=1 Tax=Emergomyces pasteurianus Ep9510 TaxID=1447872 RepID=A0A1J9P2F8_9EURO|nr:hypothetical protein AJ78_08599 [Emergomyces pasteurianus Ep9510]